MPLENTYTCSDYREEMRLLGLKRRLKEEMLGPDEKERIKAEIAELEKSLQLD